jgi:hypothetical protein
MFTRERTLAAPKDYGYGLDKKELDDVFGEKCQRLLPVRASFPGG